MRLCVLLICDFTCGVLCVCGLVVDRGSGCVWACCILSVFNHLIPFVSLTKQNIKIPKPKPINYTMKNTKTPPTKPKISTRVSSARSNEQITAEPYSAKQQSNADGNGGPNSVEIQKLLDENLGLINTIQEYQNLGKVNECLCYQRILHRNLMYLMGLQK